MFCNHCGTKNPEGALYCSNDGVALTQVSERVQLVREEMRFCKNCSHESGLVGNYCSSCGTAFEKVTEKVETEKVSLTATSTRLFTPSAQSSEGFLATLTDRNHLIHSLKYIGIAIVTLFIISWITSSSANSVLQETFSGDLGPLAEGLKLISMTDVFMLNHMASLDYTVETGFFEAQLKTSSGLFLLLLIPAIIFILIGYFMQRKCIDSTMVERLTRSLSFAIVYGVIVGVISLFAGVSTKFEDPTGFVGEITASADYSFFESIFNAVIISFIFTTVGSLIGLAKEQRLINYQYGLSITRAIVTSVIGLAISIVAGIVLLQSNEEITIDNGTADTILASQVGGYLWSISQFNGLTLNAVSYDEEITASYSLLGGAKASEDEAEFKEMFGEISGILWLLVLIPIGLHFWAGTQLRKATQGNLLYELVAYAVAFGIVNVLLVWISKLTVTTNFDDAFTVSFGFSTISTFIISTIFAFVVSYGAVMVTNRQAPQTYGQSHSA
ncbi:zinc ribbon domain-containing protein [Litchfieldia alkalitelluris]|uniref:zinc ribbon domain-containing protein n=1 Tax=Litchfieldia alkalitelluris TaxID=304268 RepID=UPI000998C3D4|nr:zinc ribbon domain-containing protein [Litchfieldia alkalitelluris]